MPNCYQLSIPNPNTDNITLFKLIKDAFNISEFIPISFYSDFYKEYGRDRKYQLESFISAFLLQKFLAMNTDSALIRLLIFSQEMAQFCGFNSIPNKSKFSLFRTKFHSHLKNIFDTLSEFTDQICEKINAKASKILIADTTGYEANVVENNHKYLGAIVKRLINQNKDTPDFNPYPIAFAQLPKTSVADKSIRQMYINGHFAYAHKLMLITDGLGIIKDIIFLDESFKDKYNVDLNYYNYDDLKEAKTASDSAALIPSLRAFFENRSNNSYNIFLGDSGFDAIKNYTVLIDEFNFKKVLIPINPRNDQSLKETTVDDYGNPICPKKLTMKYSGICKENGRAIRFQWRCPKTHVVNKQYVNDCEEPCSQAIKGRTIYTFENDYRKIPGIQRGSDAYDKLYKMRTAIERTIGYFKDTLVVQERKFRNINSVKSDFYFAGILQLLGVILANKLGKLEKFRSIMTLFN
jgi:Transposase domain (DUF772).